MMALLEAVGEVSHAFSCDVRQSTVVRGTRDSQSQSQTIPCDSIHGYTSTKTTQAILALHTPSPLEKPNLKN